MSDGLCSYCGKRLEQGWHKDHYLPQDHFPFLADCWYNFLPSCEACNRAKSDFVPPVLAGKVIIEEYQSQVFKHHFVLDERCLPHQAATNERIIDPTFDTPVEHLNFEPSSCEFRARTPIGDCTIRKIFGHRELVKQFTKISDATYKLAEDNSPPSTVQAVIDICSYPFVGEALYQYWQGFFPSTPSSNIPLVS